MKYQVRQEGSLSIVEIEGNMVGGPQADEFRQFVSDLIDGGARRVIFDLSRVRYVASPGAGMIIGTYTSLKHRGGVLKLVVATERVRNLVNLIQLYRILDVYETLEEAVASFEEQGEEGRRRPAPAPDSKRDEAVSAG